MRRALIILLFAFVLPAHAHHTKEHVLGAPAPPPPVVTVPATTDDTGGSRLLWALGPFFLLVAVGVFRWGYRHRQEGKNKSGRD